ncbi:MAG TPA: hypothetical protein VK607_07320 [Kofleriaceae bacterium]|nr:hypothetical protein [Kofleriaceae bacterium]
MAQVGDAACERVLPPDGEGGCYAVVEVFASCSEPVNAIVTHYAMAIAGTSRYTSLTIHDQADWWYGDRFVAHLRPVRQARTDAKAPAPGGCRCDDGDGYWLAVDRMIAIDHDDTRTLARIAAKLQPMPERSDGTLSHYEPGRTFVDAVVTSERRWRVHEVYPQDSPRTFKLGPVPATARPGAHFYFIAAPGKPIRFVASVDPRANGWLPTLPFQDFGVCLGPAPLESGERRF